MRHENNGTAVGQDFFDSWNGCCHSVVIGDAVFFIERNVEVDADEGFFVAEVVVVDG